jgi:hypothetical protein
MEDIPIKTINNKYSTSGTDEPKAPHLTGKSFKTNRKFLYWKIQHVLAAKVL